jgi:hypothetical protein
LNHFAALEALGEGATKCSLNFGSKETMCEDSTSFDLVKVHSPAYLPSSSCLFEFAIGSRAINFFLNIILGTSDAVLFHKMYVKPKNPREIF